MLEGEGELDSPIREDAGSLGHCPDPLEIKRSLKHVKSISDPEISKEDPDLKIRGKGTIFIRKSLVILTEVITITQARHKISPMYKAFLALPYRYQHIRKLLRYHVKSCITGNDKKNLSDQIITEM